MVILLYGEDSFRSRQKLKQLKNRFKEIDPSGINLSVIDGNNTDISEIKKQVTARPFLSKKRMVLIENLLTEGKSSLQKEAAEFFKLFLKKESAEIIVIFWEKDNLDQRKALFKILSKTKTIQKFDLLQGYQLNSWIKREIQQKGGDIDQEAANKLAAYVGNNLWQMSNEIDKLLAFKNKKKITSPDIDILVKAKLDTNIFNLTDAIGQKNKKKALKLLHDQIESGQHALYLLTMVTYQFRNLLIVKSLLEQNKDPYLVSKKSKIHPYVLQKTIPQTKNFSLDELKTIYQKLLDTDVALKTSDLEPVLALDILITSLCN